ncbi:MAG: ABC transporter substrate-binding protein [Ktedonobacterales bacterium]|nr:ABC transporter substrate-binding protein [Ktedonobacterales bacterium]
MRIYWLLGAGRRAHWALIAGVAALVPLLAAGCATPSSSSSYSGPVATVSLAWDYTPNTNHTGIYAAYEQGWYRQNGINLTFIQPGATAPEALVGAGKADFAISYTEAVTSSRAAGIPLVSIAAILRHNTSELVTLKSSGLDTVAKLAGKRYAGFGAPQYEKPVIEQVLSCGGATNPSFHYTSTDVSALTALQSGRFDFAWVFHAYDTLQAQQKGIALNVFPITDYCLPDYYTPVLITSTRLIQQYPDVIRRFLKATAQGYTYASAHPRAAADLLIKGAPAGSFQGTSFVYASQDYLSPIYLQGAPCWGEQTLAKWTNYPRFMYTHQALVDANGNPLTGPPDYAAAYTNQFLPPCA